MNYSRFWMFNVRVAIVWVGLFLCAGYLIGTGSRFGTTSTGHSGIIFVSLLPILFEYMKARKEAAAEKSDGNSAGNP